MGLRSTIRYIVQNPGRSTAWKVFDVTLLCGLWAFALASAVVWFVAVSRHLTGAGSRTLQVEARLATLVAVPLAFVATLRTWYSSPGRRGRTGGSGPGRPGGMR